MNPEVPMSDDKDTKRFSEDDESLTGDALLHAMRRDMLALFKGLDHKVEALDAKVEVLDAKVEGLNARVEALDAKVEALDAKVEARLRDTTPMWEVVVARLDTIVAEQESHGRRLAAIEIKLERFDVIDTELRNLRRRIDRMFGLLNKDIGECRIDQHDLEDRVEKLEKTPA
jgi:chromosome segregation ATPase